ncbi:MAG: insulinase family protein, partial [Leptonema sp. (in: Bacteria)]|nr:insulinase family protein [Leptonema sp. (in: bacteria)]
MNLSLNLQHPLKLYKVGNVSVGYIQNSSYLTTIQIFTKVGSQIEQPDQFGIAHILEHMFFKGSKKRPGAVTIPRAANDIGAHINAYTTYDHTSYYITALNDSFEEAADILCDMFRNPLFPEAEFQKELKPILSEYRDRDDDPDDFINERALERYYGKNYHPIIGTEKSIRQATTESMHNFKNRYYGSNNVFLVVVGGVDEDQMLRVLNRHFSDLQPSEQVEYQTILPTSNDFELQRSSIQEAHFNLFFEALPFEHPKRHHQDLFNYVLGASDSSFLFERIRE